MTYKKILGADFEKIVQKYLNLHKAQCGSMAQLIRSAIVEYMINHA